MIALALIGAAAVDTLDAEAVLVHLDESAEELPGVLERLDELKRRPLDLNTCSVGDLIELPFVTAAEAGAVVAYRRDHGPYLSTESLSAVTGLDATTRERMLPFVAVRPLPGGRPRPVVRGELIQRWTRKLEVADGFKRDSSGYLGSPDVMQTRVRISVGKLSLRTTLDKDAGEPMTLDVRRPSLGYDFMSGHVQLKDIGWLRHTIVGDFSMRFAHGVLLRAPGSLRSAAASGHGGSASLRPYASASEGGHFRGAAIELAPANWISLTAFASRRRIDAGIDTTAGGDFPLISRRSTGLHRTAGERMGRGALQESAIGGAIRAAFGPISLAAAHFSSEEMVTVRDTATAAFVSRAPFRRRIAASSFSAAASFGNLYLAAEWTPAAGLSATAEFHAGRHSRVAFAVQRGKRSTYLPTSALAGGSDGHTKEVTDLLLQGRHRLSDRTKIEYAVGHSLRRAPTDRVPFATVSSAADVSISHQPKPWLTLVLRGTQRLGEEASTCTGGSIRCVGSSSRHSIRYQIDYRHSRRIECRIRAEHVSAGTKQVEQHAAAQTAAPVAPSRGFLLYEELRLRPAERLLVTGRLAVFAADQHPARIYTYESDLTYAFSSPSFSGRGRRAYVLVRWKTARAVAVEAKWSSTTFENVKSIGTGRDAIKGGRVREIRFQFRLSFR